MTMLKTRQNKEENRSCSIERKLSGAASTKKPAGPVGAEIHRIPHAKSEQKQFCETMFFRLEKHKKEFGNGPKNLMKMTSNNN